MAEPFPQPSGQQGQGESDPPEERGGGLRESREALPRLSVNQASALLGISQGRAYELVRTGVLPAVHRGRDVWVDEAALDRFMDARSDIGPVAPVPSGASGVELSRWLAPAGGIAHLVTRDDEAGISYALDIVREAQSRSLPVVWVSCGVPPTEWLMSEKGIRPDLSKHVWDCAQVGRLALAAIGSGFKLIVWEKPFAALPQEEPGNFDKSGSAALSRELNALLPVVRRAARAARATLVLVNKASRRPGETLYQPSFGAIIKRAGVPFMTVYLHCCRELDSVPRTAAEGERLKASLVNLQPALRLLNRYELRYGVKD